MVRHWHYFTPLAMPGSPLLRLPGTLARRRGTLVRQEGDTAG
ncbi:hypothetical protein ARTSIC4J27_3792 [Pseudarthrobacter siccitolerans]|uniref:Uncharacterized protein n=1 Tax=Pseudarthrobacter siccitolerans TaxID=861266 RepID=A0A024H7R5_9MICC|nr:hypothetical protein ARTSIC4J27_3792 [Pseudarthrobacter siccitolerans]